MTRKVFEMASVIAPVLRHAGANPDHIALRGAQHSWTYAQLRDAALAYARALRTQGTGPGDRVLLIAPTVPEFVIAYLGIAALGAVVVPVNTMSTRAELEYFIGDAGCSLVVAWHELGPAAAEAAAAQGIPYWSLTDGAQAGGDALGAVCDRASDDVAVIVFTSGTTGRPKGAELTVGNLLSAGDISARFCDITADDRVGTGLPLFHVFGQTAVLMSALTAGATVSLLARFTAKAMLDLLRRDRLTVMCGVPTMWNAMLHDAGDATAADFAQLRLAVSGGASLPAEVARAFQQKFGCTLLEGYGLTETTAVATFSGAAAPPGTVGQAVFDTQIEIRDLSGEPVGPNTAGEVYVKGPTVMRGYHNRPEATSEVLSADGWLRTGDIGELDDAGNLRIVDRAKDLIIRGGYNVYPSEVEAALYEHPDIVEAAVVGIPHPHYGEEVAAVVVVRPGSPHDGPAITAWSRERLSAYKIPRVVQFVDELPKGSTGKIIKRAIDREPLAKIASDQAAK
jgi:long-chain acyl-CoA synthetase